MRSVASIPSPTHAVWHLGPLPVRAYALCIVAGIFVCVALTLRRWRARGGRDEDVWDVAQKLRGCFGADTLVGWDERDLLSWVEGAGFTDVEITVEIEVKPRPMAETRDWDVFRSFAPNPLAPTLQEAMDERLTPDEQERLVSHLRPLVERGEGSYRMASAYVRAVKF